MVLILLGCCLSLLSPGLSRADETERGCRSWTAFRSRDVCCEACHPGNRLVYKCGEDPKALCTPCEDDTFTEHPAEFSCQPCNQCVGSQTMKKACTSTKDTECTCIGGYRCGDGRCTFCVKECGKGEEPTDERSCQQCPSETFNDQIHQKCKPWRTSCPHPEHIVRNGNASRDHECSSSRNSTPAVVVLTSKKTEPGVGGGESTAGLVVAVATLLLVAVFLLTVISIILNKIVKKKKKTIIRTATPDEPSDESSDEPSDNPRSLVSFHEPEQEQGSSSETLASQESQAPLIV